MQGQVTRYIAAAALAAAALPSYANAQIVTGQIPVSLKLTAACIIEGNLFHAGGANTPTSFATLAFPDTPSVSATSTTEVSANVSIAYKCSADSSPKITLSNGQNFSANERHMKFGATNYVPYKLYEAAGQVDEISTNALDLASDGLADSITIHATAFIPETAPIGTYTDTITVTLTL